MRTNDDTIVQNNQVEDFKRSDWADIGGQAQGQPVAACGADDRMVVLAIAEGELQVKDASGNVNLWAQNQKPASEGGDWTEWSPRIGGSGILHPDPNCAPDGKC